VFVNEVTEGLVGSGGVFQGLGIDMEMIATRVRTVALKTRKIFETKSRKRELTCSISAWLETTRRHWKVQGHNLVPGIRIGGYRINDVTTDWGRNWLFGFDLKGRVFNSLLLIRRRSFKVALVILIFDDWRQRCSRRPCMTVGKQEMGIFRSSHECWGKDSGAAGDTVGGEGYQRVIVPGSDNVGKGC